jgi:two-component system, OmpR family, sensor histidine kinase BaeS
VNSSTQAQASVPAWLLWFAALILAGCETCIDFDAWPGLNWLLSTLSVATVFVLFARLAGKPLTADRWLSLLLACAIAGGAAVSANPAVEALVLLGVIVSLAVGLLLGSGAISREELGAREILWAPASAGLVVLREAGARLGQGARDLSAAESVPTVRGIAFATPITVGLGLLLSNADPVMAAWRDSAWQVLTEMTFLGRTLFFLMAGILMLGALGHALRAPLSSERRRHPAEMSGIHLGATERAIILTAVVALFGLFLVLQLTHLFVDAADVRAAGLTYAQAAHEGFAELTIAASLCVLLLVAISRSSGATGLNRGEKTLSVALIVESQILLLSGFQRIVVYEDSYGFTELRLFVQVYEGCVFVALGLLILEVLGRLNFQRHSQRCAIFAAIALLGLVYWNHAAWIAQENLARYERSGVLDVRYLVRTLGPDAVPALLRSLPALPAALQLRLRSCLRAQYTPASINALRNATWYEWSYGRGRLVRTLERLSFVQDAGAVPLTVPGADPCR